MIERFPKPAALAGENLRAELVAAGIAVRSVVLYQDTNEIQVEGDNLDRGQVEAVIAAHTGALTPEQQQTLDDVTTLRNALNSGTTPEHIKASIRRLGIRP